MLTTYRFYQTLIEDKQMGYLYAFVCTLSLASIAHTVLTVHNNVNLSMDFLSLGVADSVLNDLKRVWVESWQNASVSFINSGQFLWLYEVITIKTLSILAMSILSFSDSLYKHLYSVPADKLEVEKGKCREGESDVSSTSPHWEQNH